MQIDHIAAIEAVWAALVFLLFSGCHLLWVAQMRMRSRLFARLHALRIPLGRRFSGLSCITNSSFSKRTCSLIAEDVVFR